MAQPVTINVDLDATDALNELAELEILMKSIGSDFRDMDTDSITGDIQDMVDALESAERRTENISRHMQNAARAWDDMGFEGLPAMGSGGGGGGGGGGSRGDGGSKKNSIQDLLQKLDNLYGTREGFRMDEQMRLFDGQRRGSDGRFISNTRDPLLDEAQTPARGMNGELFSKRMQRLQAGIDWSGTSTSAAGDDFSAIRSTRSRLMANLRDSFDLNESGNITGGEYLEAFENKMKKMMPTMRKWWQLLALIIPLLIAAGVQALGVAAAFGAIAVAGASIIGLGLIGHADNMGAAFQQAKLEIADFKQELFDVFSPTAQAFAPIQSEFMDFAPSELTGVADAMKGLVVYSDILFDTWSALAGGTEEFMNILVRNESVVGQLTSRFGGLIGSGALEFFDWLIQSAYRNQNMLVQLGGVLVDVMVAIYNVSMAVSTVVAAFAPMFKMLVWISDILNTGVVINLITMIALLYMLGKAALVIYGMYSGFMMLVSGIQMAVGWLTVYELSTWGAVAATLALVAAVGLLTLGAATVIGGAVTGGVMAGSDIPSSPGGSLGGGGPNFGGGGMTVQNTYNSNYQFESNGPMSGGQEQRIRTEFKRMEGQSSAMKPPDVNDGSSSSTTNKNAGNGSKTGTSK
ncbi:hypothetical protein [Halomonas sp.]|uniref:hypothetical protein n=1 Tax=Halomonas sp. TaxID=1486246 RepID=UPI0035699BB5